MIFEPRRLPEGRLEVPARAEGPDGVIGDGLTIIGPGDDLYAEWLRWFEDSGTVWADYQE